ncbi:hypothetical protein DFH07DRAFT_768803 [Mycena maculata]|uniref:Uncharacterized protein n=1 Tax=Mycena maculata TaxID=230809 RepID=A0AAD7JTN9_9AGAR|nr:hypothetical protein DFH07DRAFT_768803 [Mycena maculata]
MKFTFGLSLLFASMTALMLGAAGAPTKRDIFSPPILYPHAGTVWYSFQYHNVTWDTAGAPTTISNEALLLLASGGVEAPFILAKGFDLRLGRVQIQVPYVLANTNYQLVLFGDSGNLGPVFTIESDTPA